MGPPLTPAVKNLLFLNIGIFIFQFLFEKTVAVDLIPWFGLQPTFLQDLTWWQIISYMFLHAGPMHLFMNMIMLWLFGSEVEANWGSKAFLKYYMICGVGAGLLQVFFSVFIFVSPNTIVGASGAIMGLLMAFALIDPDREITFLLLLVLPIRLKAKYLVIIFAALSLFLGLDNKDNVAHFAHLGGMLVGYVYLKLDWRTNMIAAWFEKRNSSKEVIKKAQKRQHEKNVRQNVDDILDRINEVGYENLTEEEKSTLKRASQFLSNQKSGRE